MVKIRPPVLESLVIAKPNLAFRPSFGPRLGIRIRMFNIGGAGLQGELCLTGNGNSQLK